MKANKWVKLLNKQKKLIQLGVRTGKIEPYDEDLIKSFRNIYFGGLPASIILLCNKLCNGHCYDMSLLMAHALLNSDDDIMLVYASVDSLRYNPNLNLDDSMSCNHCFVERVLENGKHLIYDTSIGIVCDKELYWELEHPDVRKINDKESIKKFISLEQHNNITELKYSSFVTIPLIELTYNMSGELYSDLLKREVERFKKLINYNQICVEVEKDIKRLGLIK